MDEYNHPEAFCLMTYRDAAGNREIIWNSRDGVTPFIVTSRQGLESQHVNWKDDKRDVRHVPKIGDRIFETLTEDRATEYRTKYVERHLENGIMDAFPGKTVEQIVEVLVCGDMEQEGAPMITVVTEEWLAEHARKARP